MRVCAEIALIKNKYNKETSQFIWFVNQLTTFYMGRIFTERYCRKDYHKRQHTCLNVDTQRCDEY